MKNFLIPVLVVICLGCNQEDRYLNALVLMQKDANEKLITKFTERNRNIYDKVVFDKVTSFHQDVLAFIDSIDQVEEESLFKRLDNFEQTVLAPRVAKDEQVVAELPVEMLRNSSMVKLKVLQYEAVCLNNWEAWAAGVRVMKFTSLDVAIMPDKEVFASGENVTGRVMFGALAMVPENGTITLLGQKIVTKDGVGYFNFLPKKDFSGSLNLFSEITFPGNPPAIWKSDTVSVMVKE